MKSLESLLAEIEKKGLRVSECDPDIAKEEGSEPWFDVYRADGSEHLQCFDTYDEAIHWAASYLGLDK